MYAFATADVRCDQREVNQLQAGAVDGADTVGYRCLLVLAVCIFRGSAPAVLPAITGSNDATTQFLIVILLYTYIFT